MRISVECGGFTAAADACRAGNQVAALVCESLSGALADQAGMAGDDAASTAFASSYDDGAREAVAAVADLADAFTGLGRLLVSTGDNHRRAEEASAGRVNAYSGGSLPDSFVRVRPDVAPSTLGATAPDLGSVPTWILSHVEGFVWPGADVERVLEVAAVWRRTACAVAGLDDHCATTLDLLREQRSPEIELAAAAIAELRELVADTASALIALATACEEYADAVRDAHRRTLALLAEIGQMVVEGVVISVVATGVTGGLGGGVGLSATIARISAHSPRFHAVLAALRVASTACASRLRTAREGLQAVRARAQKFTRAAVRDERGSMKLPGGWGREVGAPGWLRSHEVPPGHTLREHVGKTTDELLDRVRRSGIDRASSFDDQANAERLINSLLSRSAKVVEEWRRSGSTEKLMLQIDTCRPTGTTVMADGTVLRPTGVRAILIPTKNGDGGWQLLTAFPN